MKSAFNGRWCTSELPLFVISFIHLLWFGNGKMYNYNSQTTCEHTKRHPHCFVGLPRSGEINWQFTMQKCTRKRNRHSPLKYVLANPFIQYKTMCIMPLYSIFKGFFVPCIDLWMVDINLFNLIETAGINGGHVHILFYFFSFSKVLTIQINHTHMVWRGGGEREPYFTFHQQICHFNTKS